MANRIAMALRNDGGTDTVDVVVGKGGEIIEEKAGVTSLPNFCGWKYVPGPCGTLLCGYSYCIKNPRYGRVP